MMIMLTVADAAARLGVCEKTVRRWLRSGQLRGCRLPGGREWRIDPMDVHPIKRGERDVRKAATADGE